MKRKRLISTILLLALCLSLSTAAFAARDFSEGERKATALKSLGLFQGVSASDFDLDRPANRAEALVMFVRVIGAEKTALAEKNSHPFSDVPAWADSYVGYAYRQGLTKGQSQTEFGANHAANAAMYLTFVLRALDYSDQDNRDFSWDKPFALAGKLGLTPSTVDLTQFLRADMALVSWAALEAPVCDSCDSLSETLMQRGLFTRDAYTKAKQLASGDSSSGGGSSTNTPSTAEQRVAALVNTERSRLGLNTLTLDPVLSQLATTRATETVTQFAHSRPDGRQWHTVMKDSGYTYQSAGENIAYGYPSAEAVMEGWMNSPGHYQNIIGASFTKIGVGHVKVGNLDYWVQLFAS